VNAQNEIDVSPTAKNSAKSEPDDDAGKSGK